jgi:hypothetical protein
VEYVLILDHYRTNARLLGRGALEGEGYGATDEREDSVVEVVDRLRI